MPSAQQLTKSERLKRGPQFARHRHEDRKTQVVNWLMDVCIGMSLPAAGKLCDEHCVRWMVLAREGATVGDAPRVRAGRVGGGVGNSLGFHVESNIVTACIRLQ